MKRPSLLHPAVALLQGYWLILRKPKIIAQAAQSVEDWQILTLRAERNYVDLAIAWRIAMERPEVDMRDELDRIIEKSRDEVARLEERII